MNKMPCACVNISSCVNISGGLATLAHIDDLRAY